jgi:hypothetical protein
MKYYIPIDRSIIVENPHDVPLLINMRWRRQPRGADIQLSLIHPDGNDNHARTCFSRFDVTGISFDDSQGSSYPKATLVLKGKCESKPLFALLVLNLLDWGSGVSITLSPVPFGTDCKPKLPNTPGLKESILFLFGRKSMSWLVEPLISHLHGLTAKIKGANIGRILFELQQIGVGEQEGNNFRVVMSPERFKEIFGGSEPKPGIKQPWLLRVGP